MHSHYPITITTIHPHNSFHLANGKLYICYMITPKTLATITLLSVPMILTTLCTSYTWDHTVFDFLWWLISLSVNILKVHACCSIWQEFLKGWLLYHCMDILHFAFPSIHWCILRLLPRFNYLWIILSIEYIFKTPLFIHLSIYPEMEFLAHTVILFLIIWEASILGGREIFLKSIYNII